MEAARYLDIAEIALRYLTISATEVPSEQMFSTAENIAKSPRESLEQDHVEKLAFCVREFAAFQ